jgi:hypothetical protein
MADAKAKWFSAFESSFRFSSLFEHDLFRKPLSTFRDHALGFRASIEPLRGRVKRSRRTLSRGAAQHVSGALQNRDRNELGI